MATLNKLSNPKISESLNNDKDLIYKLSGEQYLNGSLFENCFVEYIDEDNVEIKGCHFKNVNFLGCSFENIDLSDTVFEKCDLSNMNFLDGSIHRCIFKNCKLTGANFSSTNLQNVLFEECLGTYANFSFSKFKLVNFDKCAFDNSNFLECKFTFNKIAFNSCDLSFSDFRNTLLGGIDFTDSNIDEISLTGKELMNAIVTPMQAVQLSKLLGLVIR